MGRAKRGFAAFLEGLADTASDSGGGYATSKANMMNKLAMMYLAQHLQEYGPSAIQSRDLATKADERAERALGMDEELVRLKEERRGEKQATIQSAADRALTKAGEEQAIGQDYFNRLQREKNAQTTRLEDMSMFDAIKQPGVSWWDMMKAQPRLIADVINPFSPGRDKPWFTHLGTGEEGYFGVHPDAQRKQEEYDIAQRRALRERVPSGLAGDVERAGGSEEYAKQQMYGVGSPLDPQQTGSEDMKFQVLGQVMKMKGPAQEAAIQQAEATIPGFKNWLMQMVEFLDTLEDDEEE